MVARNLARYLAPAALVAVIVATVLIVRVATGSSSHTAASGRAQPLHAAVHHAVSAKTFYVIQAGDSLSSISVKTGVSVPTLEALNPAVDPNTLQTGRRLRLRR